MKQATAQKNSVMDLEAQIMQEGNPTRNMVHSLKRLSIVVIVSLVVVGGTSVMMFGGKKMNSSSVSNALIGTGASRHERRTTTMMQEFMPASNKVQEPDTAISSYSFFERMAICVSAPNNSDCSSYPPLLNICPSQLRGLSFLFNGGTCEQSDLPSGPHFDCVDYQEWPSDVEGHVSYIVVSDLTDDRELYRGWVATGQEVSFDEQGLGFGPYQKISVYNSSVVRDTANLLQEIRYHSWYCSGEMQLAQRYGSFQLVSWLLQESLFAAAPPVNGTFHFDLVVENDSGSGQSLQMNEASVFWTSFVNLTDKIDGVVVPLGESVSINFFSGPMDLFATERFTFLSYVAGTVEEDSSNMCIGSTFSEEVIGGVEYGFPSSSSILGETTNNIRTSTTDQLSSSPCGDGEIRTGVQCTVSELCGLFDFGLP